MAHRAAQFMRRPFSTRPAERIEHLGLDHRQLVRLPLLNPSPLDAYRASEATRTARHEHYILVSEGDGGIDTNFAAAFGPVAPDRFFEAAGQFFAGQPYAALVESGTATSVETRLQDLGWELDEEEIAMVLAPLTAVTMRSTDLHITRVKTDKAYEDFMQVVPGNRDWVPSLAAATDPAVALFLGYVNETPVATARVVSYGSVAEITAVQTLEEHRRKGYGRAMTSVAVNEIFQRGGQAAILTATEMGFPLYRDMGFETVCTYRTYVPPGRAHDR